VYGETTGANATGAAVKGEVTGASATSIGVYAKASGASYSGSVLQVDLGATTGASPLMARFRYVSATWFSAQPVRADESAYAFTTYSDQIITANASVSGRHINSVVGIKVPTGVTNAGEWICRFDQTVRNNQYTGDTGTLLSLRAYNISVGHDNLDASTPTTTDVHGVYVKVKSLSGTITNSYAFRCFHETGAGTVTNNWGFFNDNPTMMNAFEGKSIFGAHTAPSETIDCAAGNVRVLGTTSNTLKVANQVNNGAVASVFTANVGPTGANTAIQGWFRLNIGGSDHYMPFW